VRLWGRANRLASIGVVGGTGKYKGISGDQKFQGNFIGDTGAGWSDWSGEYKLP
jgi:hypothetical protein